LWATAAVHFAVMGAFPDTHISREHGPEAAAATRRAAAALDRALMGADDPRSVLPDILAADRDLKAKGHNPGTSADLTVATVFACKLNRLLRAGADNA
jgi:triphosphoribosyl-dephospho-CoA synthase